MKRISNSKGIPRHFNERENVKINNPKMVNLIIIGKIQRNTDITPL